MTNEKRLTGDHTVTRKLSPTRNHDTKTESVSVRLGVKETLKVPPVPVCTIERDVLLNLGDLESDQRRVGIAGGRVVLGENPNCLVALAVGVQPTRRLGDEEDEEDVDTGGCALQVEAGPP